MSWKDNLKANLGLAENNGTPVKAPASSSWKEKLKENLKGLGAKTQTTEPNPNAMPSAIENTRNLFNAPKSSNQYATPQSFKVMGKQLTMGTAPDTSLGMSKRDPFGNWEGGLKSPISGLDENPSVGKTTPMVLSDPSKGFGINELLGLPVGLAAGAIGGIEGAVGGALFPKKGINNTKDYFKGIVNDSASLATEMYKHGSDVGAAGTKLGVATAVAPQLVGAYFATMSGIGIYNSVANTIKDIKAMKERGENNVALKAADQHFKNGSTEGYRMFGFDDDTINVLNKSEFGVALGNALLYGGAYFSSKGVKDYAGPKVQRLSNFLTKDKIIEYKLPETVKISPQEVYDIYSGKAGYENNLTVQEKGQLLSTLNLSSKEIANARQSGISIERPTEVVTKLIDKPWFSKIKKGLNIEPVEKVIGTDQLGAAKQAPAGLLNGPTESLAPQPTKSLSFAGQELLAPKTEVPAIAKPLDFNAPAVTAQPTAIEPAISQAPMAIETPSEKIVLTKDFDINQPDSPATLKAQFEGEILQGLKEATAGRRYVNEVGDAKVAGSEKSTFPQWLPSEYRRSNIVQPVLEHIYNDTLPTKKAELGLYNLLKEEFANYGTELEAVRQEIDLKNLDFGQTEKALAREEEILKQYDNEQKSLESGVADKSLKTTSSQTKTKEVVADKGEYSDVKGKGKTELKTMETPEQFRLAKAIGPDMKFVIKNLRTANGYFRGADQTIALNRKLFKKSASETKEQYQTRIGKTVGHEIFHFVDFLPEGSLKRGNLIGRLQTLSQFKQNFIAEPEVLKRRQEIMRKINEINKDDTLLDSQVDKLTEPLMKELAGINRGITFNNPAFKEELVKLSKEWKPWEEGLDEGYDAYRKSAVELYADFGSVLLNDPALAQEMAPRFFTQFFDFLGKKPEVEKALLGIQAELMGDRTSLMEKRYRMLKESGQNAQGRFAAMVAEREAIKKHPWLVAILRDMWYQHYWTAKKGVEVKGGMEILDRGFNNEVFLWTDKNIKPIIQDLKAAGLEYGDLDSVLILERIAKDITRENVANIKGLDVKTAEDVLSELTNILGKEKAEAVVKAAKDLRLALKELQLKFPDLWTPEMIKLIESNDFYAAFNVLFKETNNVNYYIKESTGNLDKDFSPFVNTLLRAKSVMNYGSKNVIRKSIVDSMLEENMGDIKKAEVSYTKMANGQLVRTVKKAPQNWGTVDIRREGKVESYYLPEDIAHSLNQDNLGQLSPIMKPLNIITKPFKMLYTGIINPGFQVVNFAFRDWGMASQFFGPEWTRAQQGKSNSGALNILANNTYRSLIGQMRQAKYYFNAFNDVREKNLFQKYSPIVEEGLKSHIIEVDASGMYKIDTKSLSEQEDAGVKYILQTLGLSEKGSKIERFVEAGQSIAQTLEETPKLAAYTYMQDLGVLNESNLSNIRNFVGSPNFWKQGRQNKNISSFFMFFNPIIRGVGNLGKKAFVKDAFGKGSRTAFWWRMGRMAIVPALAGVAAEEGFFGEDIKKMYNKLPEYLKGSYYNIPIRMVGDKLLSISIPLDEDTRLVHAIVRNAAKLALHHKDKSIRKRALLDILAYTGGQVPSVNPAINIMRQWSVAMSGGNPFDSFRNQQILLANEEKLPTFEKAKIMAKWTLNQSGILKLNIHDGINNQTVSEQVISYTPVINRFVRTSNRGDYESDQAVVKAESEKAAMELLAKKGVVKDIVEKINKDPKYNPDMDVLELAKDRLGSEASDQKALVKEFKLLRDSVQEEYITNFGNIHYRSLVNQSNDVKTKVLLNIWDKKTMDRKEFIKFITTANSLKIISIDVLGDVLTQTGLGKVQ